MHSVRTEDGAVMELGPRSVRTAGAAGKATLSLVSSALLASLVPNTFLSLLPSAVWCVQISEVGLEEEVLPVLPSHKGASRRLIYTAHHGLLELPSSASWLYRTKPPFSRPLLPALLREILRCSLCASLPGLLAPVQYVYNQILRVCYGNETI